MQSLKLPQFALALAAAWALALPAQVSAQTYPGKPVRVVVPFAPGGATDIQARVLSKELSEQFKQSFVVDNRPGASGMIGAEIVASSPADGYSILFTINGAIRKALDSKSVRGLLEQDALAPAGGTPEELGAHFKREFERYADIIRKGNITAQ